MNESITTNVTMKENAQRGFVIIIILLFKYRGDMNFYLVVL